MVEDRYRIWTSRKMVTILMVIELLFLSGCLQGAEKSEEWKSDVTPASGAGKDPFGTGEDGPWNHRLLIAFSDDGISWQKTYKILADQASVPDIVVDNAGYVWVYYVDFYNGGIVVAISKNLEEWSYIKVKGIPPEWVDPSVVLLPDGRFRLYASYMPLGGKQNKIVSAISDDGINFEIEEGIRYESNETITDPELVYNGETFVMYVQKNVYQLGESKIVMLTSKDGLNFEYKGEIRVRGQVPCVVKTSSGYRLYLHTENFSILSYYSEDLKNWENPVEVLRGENNTFDRYGVMNPAVAELPDGGYIMVYQTWIEEPKFEVKEK